MSAQEIVLLVAPILGGLAGLREAKSFQRSIAGGHVHLIAQTGAGEARFFVEDNAAWIGALTSAAPALRR